MLDCASRVAVRRLPSVDWFAFGIGVTAFALQHRWWWLQGVAAAAITLPSVLREIGVLKDADEFTRTVARRAGFHAMAFVSGLYLLTIILHQCGVADGTLGSAETVKITEAIFLISYLLQYWGAREGVFRLFLGSAAVTASGLAGFWRPENPTTFRLTALGALLGFALFQSGLALLVRMHPRAAGRALMLLMVGATGFYAWVSTDSGTWPLVGGILQIALFFGVTGWVLLRESSSN